MQGLVIPARALSVQHFWTGYILWFSIIGQKLFGSAFLDRKPFVVQHYGAEPFMVQDYRLEPFRV